MRIRPLSIILFAAALIALAGCGRDAAKNLFADGQAAYQAKDFVKARTLYEQSCLAGEARACTGLGAMALKGEGGKADASWAAALFDKACKAGDADACAKLKPATPQTASQAATPAKENEAPPTAPTEAAPLTQSLPQAAAPAEPPPVAPAAPQSFTAHPSFDCATADNDAERLICSDDELAARDVELERLYRRARARVTDVSALRAEQRDWIALRRNACHSRECLYRVYAHRRAELEDWLGD